MAWSLKRQENPDRILVRFTGRLTTAEGQASIAALADALKHDPAIVEWDIRAMEGYESGARSAWQTGLWPIRDRFQGLTIRGGSALVRLGASTLALFLGVPFSFVDEQ